MSEDINLDAVGYRMSPAGMILRRAIAQAQDGPVWITEGGKRIAAIVPAEWAEAAKVILAARQTR